jgi:hypothetical protein
VFSFTFIRKMSETDVEGAELAMVVGQTAPLAKVQDLKMLRSSLPMIQQQGNINADEMFQQIENLRVIVQRKVLLVLENGLQNRSDMLEPLRQRLDRRGHAYLPFMEGGHEDNWTVALPPLP